eukprot:scaffold207893_cov24-Tisochrysis_lutea.AAC.2
MSYSRGAVDWALERPLRALARTFFLRLPRRPGVSRLSSSASSATTTKVWTGRRGSVSSTCGSQRRSSTSPSTE